MLTITTLLLSGLVCTGANYFFRQLQVKGEWEYLDSINTTGKGSPVLSKEVRDLMKSVMRAEKKEGKYHKKPTQPVFSTDVVLFSEKVAGVEAMQLQNLVDKIKQSADLSTGELQEAIKSAADATVAHLVQPEFTRAVIELTRSSVHRSEAPALMHGELYPTDHGWQDMPVFAKHRTVRATAKQRPTLPH
jgi:hypothetical protein